MARLMPQALRRAGSDDLTCVVVALQMQVLLYKGLAENQRGVQSCISRYVLQ